MEGVEEVEEVSEEVGFGSLYCTYIRSGFGSPLINSGGFLITVCANDMNHISKCDDLNVTR